MKKLKIFILTLLMVLTLLPVNTLANENKPSNEPDVSVYAKKTQLMDAFAPDEYGNAKNIGSIIFGKNSQQEAQEWYILENDTNVNDGKDNTIILAKTPIIKDKKFYDLSDQGEKVTDGNVKWLKKSSNYEDCIYPQEFKITDDSWIAINHYGTSDVRAYLKEITSSKEKGYFSTEELKMLNSTVITTEDLYNNTSYTTEDKLYLPNKSTEMYDSIMNIGSDNQISIQYSDYKIPNSFWLRSPKIAPDYIDGTNYYSNTKYANIGLVLLSSSVEVIEWACVSESEKQFNNGEKIETRNIGVVPVGNLNLSNVLFASAAKAETAKINSSAAMTLRLKGDVTKLGSVTAYYSNGYIEVTKGTASNVKLVV